MVNILNIFFSILTFLIITVDFPQSVFADVLDSDFFLDQLSAPGRAGDISDVFSIAPDLIRSAREREAVGHMLELRKLNQSAGDAAIRSFLEEKRREAILRSSPGPGPGGGPAHTGPSIRDDRY